MYVCTYLRIYTCLFLRRLCCPLLFVFLLNAIAVVICGVRFRRSVPACVSEVFFGENSFSSHPILCQLFFYSRASLWLCFFVEKRSGACSKFDLIRTLNPRNIRSVQVQVLLLLCSRIVSFLFLFAEISIWFEISSSKQSVHVMVLFVLLCSRITLVRSFLLLQGPLVIVFRWGSLWGCFCVVLRGLN